MAFDEPGEIGGDRINPADVVGHLLLVWAVGYIEHSPTKYSLPGKNSDVIVVDCVDLDDTTEMGYGKLFRRSWWRNGRLIGALRDRIGRPNPMLAVMALGIPTKGQPPLELISATRDAESVTRANQWLTANPDFKPSSYTGGDTPAAPQQDTRPAPVERAAAPNETMLERMARIAQGAGLPPRPPAEDADIPF